MSSMIIMVVIRLKVADRFLIRIVMENLPAESKLRINRERPCESYGPTGILTGGVGTCSRVR